jgi:hypothetical protein
MREIVHLQVGQCGNQIGSKVSNILHNFRSSSYLPSENYNRLKEDG